MALVELASLIVASTKASILQKLYDLATAVGLDTETWQEGDPTRTQFDITAEMLEIHERVAVEIARGGYLDLASGPWLTLLARYGFNVERRPATRATTTIRLTNGSGAVRVFEAEGYTALSTGKATYKNVEDKTLPGGIGQTVDVLFEAEEAGIAGNAAPGEINAWLYPVPKVTLTNLTAAAGAPEETDSALRERCRAKIQALSPNGPKGIYHYVATTPELNGGALVTRTRVLPDSDTGEVTVYLAGPAGPVTTDDRDLVEEAYETYATPHCVEVSALLATALVVPITYQLWVYDTIGLSEAEIKTAVSDSLIAMLRELPIGGDVIPPAVNGALYQGRLVAAILGAVTLEDEFGSTVKYGFRVSVSNPSGDLVMTPPQVATLGTLTATVTFVRAP